MRQRWIWDAGGVRVPARLRALVAEQRLTVVTTAGLRAARADRAGRRPDGLVGATDVRKLLGGNHARVFAASMAPA